MRALSFLAKRVHCHYERNAYIVTLNDARALSF